MLAKMCRMLAWTNIEVRIVQKLVTRKGLASAKEFPISGLKEVTMNIKMLRVINAQIDL